MSFNHVVIPTRGKWFQTNSLEHEHDEWGSCVHLLCVLPMAKITAVQLQIMINICRWLRKTEIPDRIWISCESLVSYDLQILLTILAVSSNLHLEAVQFLSHWNNVEKLYWSSLFETSVKEP